MYQLPLYLVSKNQLSTNQNLFNARAVTVGHVSFRWTCIALHSLKTLSRKGDWVCLRKEIALETSVHRVTSKLLLGCVVRREQSSHPEKTSSWTLSGKKIYRTNRVISIQTLIAFFILKIYLLCKRLQRP